MNEITEPQDPETLRREVDAAIADGDAALVKALLAGLWARDPGPGAAALVTSAFGRLDEAAAGLPAARLSVAVLRSFTVEPILPIARAAARLGNIDLTLAAGDFNAYTQEILTPGSAAYAGDPDAVILAVQTRDIAPELWTGGQAAAGDAAAVVDRAAADLANLIRSFRRNSNAYLIVHNLETPAWPTMGILDAQAAGAQARAVAEINRRLAEAAAEEDGVFVLDYDGLVARAGRARWPDPARWLTMRLPIANHHLHDLAGEWLRFLTPIAGRTAKALVLDLDNTLWGGVLGEDGIDGIRLDGEYPGAAFTAVQQAALDLYERGVILAVCSKNDPDDALRALESHPGMILKPEHFASLRINWRDKAANLREIAAELNIGTDALALLDDNPAERFWVRRQMPEVAVIEVGDDPLTFADAVRADAVFERLSLSDEDRARGRYYAADRRRGQLQQATSTLEDYYRSLEMVLDIEPVGAGQVARAAQLTQKTNQFNLTTRRYSEQEMRALCDDAGAMVLAASARDRFGDNGIIGIAVVRLPAAGDNARAAELDTFLMSCRVIGRTIERAFLADIARRLAEAGVTRLDAAFLATAKNGVAKDFLADNGLTKTAEDDAGSRWSLDLPAADLTVPDWVDVRLRAAE